MRHLSGHKEYQNFLRLFCPFDTAVRNSYANRRMKIVIADKITERGVALLREAKFEVVLPAKDSVAGELGAADGLIVRSATKVTAALLEKAPKLRVVGRAGVGVDNVDMSAATRRGVLVMNTPGGNAVSVAEHTFALMLALARSVPQFNASIHAGRWEKSSAMGRELRGKTLGIVGLGAVGTEVARRARAFGMRVLAHDPYVSAAVARDSEVELAPLPEVLAQSDYVSLHAGLSPATEKLINAEAIRGMKRGARLINCARGELVDEAALADALRSGQIAGAGLDTFAVEPPVNSPLVGLPNVVATPHIAGTTEEAQEEVGILIAEQVRDYLTEGQIRNAVNLPSVSVEQYRKMQPYLELSERLGALIAQVAGPGSVGSPGNVRIRYAGEPAELGTHILRSAVLVGLLNCILPGEHVNLVNAPAVAASRGVEVEETTRRREHGFPNTIEVAMSRDGREIKAEGTVLKDAAPRLLQFDGIPLETALAGTLLLTRNQDVPGVIGAIGTTLGKLGVNIATFALGRRAPAHGAEAVALVRLDGDIKDTVVDPIRAISTITEARLVRLRD
jgi:D-3-phosphoglycerate dehydrogenase / 2-oxoglutarate reductase